MSPNEEPITAEALAARLQVPQSQLESVCRQRYHRSVHAFLDDARVRAVQRYLLNQAAIIEPEPFGFQKSTDLEQAFRTRCGLSTESYRQGLHTGCFQLQLPEDFRLGETRAYLGRDPEAWDSRVSANHLVKAFDFGEVAGLIHIKVENGGAALFAESQKTLSSADHARIHQLGCKMLGLNCAPKEFEDHCRAGEHQRLIAGKPGLRIVSTVDLFEAWVWTIVGQQVNLTFAYQQRRALIELAGKIVTEKFRAHPDPAAVAQLDYGDLTARKFSRRKAEYLIDSARGMVEGSIPAHFGPEVDAETVEKTLTAVRGIGPWSCRYMMMRGLGFLDVVPIGDAGLANALKTYYGLPEKADKLQQESLLEPFRPYRALAVYHLWHSFY